MKPSRAQSNSRSRPSSTMGSASSLSFDWLDARLAAVLGAVAIGVTGPLIDIAGASSGTSSFYRALFAVPLLAMMRLVTRVHTTRRGARPTPRRSWAQRLITLLAGVFLGLDMVLWTESILTIGAGIATVVGNVQVVIVPMLSLLIFGERLRRSFWLLAPVLLAGVGLAGGAFGGHPTTEAPWYGTLMGALAGASYSIYLLVLRRTSAEPAQRLANLTDVMLAAAMVGVVAGLLTGRLDWTPGWRALAWLLLVAVLGHALAWMLLGSALPRLTASTGSVVLLIHPVSSLALSAVLLGQKPSPLQLLGCTVVLMAVLLLSRREQLHSSEDAANG